MADAHKNFATSLVATAPSPATSGTSLVVTGGEGSRFPAASFNAVICPAGASPTPANAEVVRVTNVSTDTFTITRAQESSSARTVIVGDRIYAGPTAASFDDYVAKSVWTTKGDILAATAASTPARQAVGADSTILQADASQTAGVRWGAHPHTINGVLLGQFSTKISATATASTNYFLVPGLSDQINTSLSIANTTGLYWGAQIGTRVAITGLTAYWLLQVVIQVGQTAPAKTYTITMNPITIAAGVITVGSAVTGSTVTHTSPAANAFRVANSGNFADPGSGFYAPILTINTSTPAAAVAVFANLYQVYA